MTREPKPLLTGTAAIDELRALQMTADIMIDDPDCKMAHFRRGIALLGARELLDHELMIGTHSLYGRRPDVPRRTHERFEQNFFLRGTLMGFGYMFDEDIPVDSLVLNFEGAEIISATPVDDDSFEEPTVEPAADAMHTLTPLSEIEKMRLQVPILAINSCLDVRAA